MSSEPNVIPQSGIELRSLNDLAAARAEAWSEFDEVPWFRGQESDDPGWSLKPTVYRKKKWQENEHNMAQTFVLDAPSRRASCPSIHDLPGWLTLMRHYKLPTRLLDWTESILTAAFFALCSENNSDAVIWALAPGLLNGSQLDGSGVAAFKYDTPIIELQRLTQEAFNHSKECQRILAVRAQHNDPRMLMQQSRFTIHGRSEGLETVNELPRQRFLRRYLIPQEARESLLLTIESLGCTKSVLFPDLDHLADDIAVGALDS